MPHSRPHPTDAPLNERIEGLLERYGDGEDGSAPTRAQWTRLLERPAAAPVTLINLFKLRDVAAYPEDRGAQQERLSGAEAMMRYGAVSGPALEAVGGRFLLMAPFEATAMGQDEDWDLVAIGSYPSGSALFRLFDDEAYRDAYRHRKAAVARQRVLVATG